MNARSPLDMMSPFDMAWDVLKSQSYFLIKSDNLINNLLKMGRAGDAMQLQAMRQFVLDNENSPDPAKRAQAEQMYQELTQLMNHLASSKGPSPSIPISSQIHDVNDEAGSEGGSMAGAPFSVGVKPTQEELPEEEEF